MRAVWIFGLLIGSALAGCAAPTASLDAGGDGQAAGDGRVPVVAIIDSGVTPYLGVFKEPAREYVDTHLSVPHAKIELTANGRANDDLEKWKALVPWNLYHFSGTRLLAISVTETAGSPFQTFDNTGHGTATSFVVARESPEAIIVMVQVDGGYCALDPVVSCLVEGSIATAMEWVAEQDWIDVVSVSLGIIGNPPDSGQVHPEAERYLRASEAAVRSGKLIVNSAGNDPSAALMDYFDGPPWIVGVGGAEAERGGATAESSKPVDVAANYSAHVPSGDDNVSGWRHGTSLAAPAVAGTLASALARVWAVDPARVVSPQELRDALNASAVLFSPTEWDPSPIIRDGLPDTSATTLPVIVPAQTGWGYVDASLAPEIARRILEGDLGVPAEKGQVAMFQAQWQQAREAYWAAR